jgi:hypothetical protein
MTENEYFAEYAATGRAKCKQTGCKGLIEKDTVRLGKAHPSGFHDGLQTDWYHPKCLFKSFCNAKKNTKLLNDVDDIKGYLTLKKEDKVEISKYFKEFQNGTIKREVQEEKKEKREQKKKEKELLDKVLGISKSPPSKATKSSTPKKVKQTTRFISGLIDSDSDQLDPENESNGKNKNQSISPYFSPAKKQSDNKLVSKSEDKSIISSIVKHNIFDSLSHTLQGMEKFCANEKNSLNLFLHETKPNVICIGLSPYQHPS